MDECVPVKLVRLLTGHTFATALEKGGAVSKMDASSIWLKRNLICSLSAIETFNTSKTSKNRTIAILLLSTNHWPTLKSQVATIQAALNTIKLGEFTLVNVPLND